MFLVLANAQGKRRRSTEGAEGTNKGQDNGEALALVGVRLTDQLGAEFWALASRLIVGLELLAAAMYCESIPNALIACVRQRLH